MPGSIPDVLCMHGDGNRLALHVGGNCLGQAHW